MSIWSSSIMVSRLKGGDVASGNYFCIEPDGTDIRVGSASVFEDQRYPVIGQRLDTSSGRISYNYTTLTIDYATNARYPEEPISITAQMEHGRKKDSDIYPHIHWNQTSSAFPNVLVGYRWYNNGEDPTQALTLLALVSSNNAFTYSSGTIAQITRIPLPQGLGAGKKLSSIFDIQIFRDTANTSGLFAGADTYAGVFSLKEFDIHIERDMLGSRQEFLK